MKIKKLFFPEVFIIEPKVFEDTRGYFCETFNLKNFRECVNVEPTFVQDNHSSSSKNVLRGLHYQKPPKAQGKLVRVTSGEIFDVIVDIRRSSPNFGKWISVKISSSNKKVLWIPPGFAHGFLTITENAEVTYKTTEYYSKENERGIVWNDQSIGIKWPSGSNFILSSKDKGALTLAEVPLQDLFQ